MARAIISFFFVFEIHISHVTLPERCWLPIKGWWRI